MTSGNGLIDVVLVHREIQILYSLAKRNERGCTLVQCLCDEISAWELLGVGLGFLLEIEIISIRTYLNGLS